VYYSYLQKNHKQKLRIKINENAHVFNDTANAHASQQLELTANMTEQLGNNTKTSVHQNVKQYQNFICNFKYSS